MPDRDIQDQLDETLRHQELVDQRLARRRARARPAGVATMDEVVITPYRDGPLLVRGPVRLTDQDGREIVLERETIALCRCGKSRLRPFCDGTHQLVRFRAPSGLEDRQRPAPTGS